MILWTGSCTLGDVNSDEPQAVVVMEGTKRGSKACGDGDVVYWILDLGMLVMRVYCWIGDGSGLTRRGGVGVLY